MVVLAGIRASMQPIPLKVLAVANTISFPTTVLMSGTLRPRTAVALMLAFAAKLVHLGSLLLA